MSKLVKYLILLILLVAISAACSGQEQAFSTATLPSLPATPEPTQTIVPSATIVSTTSIPAVTQTPLPSATPTVVLLPTLSGSGGGVIAYAREDALQRDIYLMNADGSQCQQLTNDANWDNWPSWSPDGSRLTHTCRYKIAGIGGGICVINVDGTGREQLSNRDDWEPSWSPDGRFISFASLRDGNPEIYMMNSDGSEERRLTHDAEDDWQASWSPDSSKIIFTSGRDGDWEIYIMDVSDGGVSGDQELVKLTDNDVMDGFPAFSPDGSRIVFTSTQDGVENIYIMDSDGSNPIQLTDSEMRVSFPRWSPDGEWIVFTSLTSQKGVYSYDIYKVKADGSLMVQLTKESMVDEMCPNWKPK